MLAEAAAEEAAAAAAMGVRRVGAVEDLRCLDEDLDREASAAASRQGFILELLLLCLKTQEVIDPAVTVEAVGHQRFLSTNIAVIVFCQQRTAF